MSRPRVFKSHIPVQFLPEQIWTIKPRIIYISRDIKDVAVAYYYLRKDIFGDGVGTIEEHFEEILCDKAWWCPYRQFLMNYQNLPNYENIYYMTYEEIVNDMEGTIRKLTTFLGKHVTEEIVVKLKEHLSFDNMKSKIFALLLTHVSNFF